MTRLARQARGWFVLVAAWSMAVGAQAPLAEVHGTSDTFAGHGIAIAWGVQRGATESATVVVLRIAADPARFTHVAVDGIDPFSKERQPFTAERPLGAFADIRIPRARFADFPRTEVRFSKPGVPPPLIVYYLGVPDTTPEFPTQSALEAHLAQSLVRLQADMKKTP